MLPLTDYEDVMTVVSSLMHINRLQFYCWDGNDRIVIFETENSHFTLQHLEWWCEPH
jgi:hypothetical protein